MESGKVALVTGAAAGAGRAIAGALASGGARVVGADLAPDADGLRLDVTGDAALVAAIEAVRPDMLVNNAGGGGHVLPHYPDATVAEWSAWLDLNLRAPMLATQVALRCGAGAVVNVASMAGIGAEPHVSPEYAAAKAGLIRFTTALADPRVSCLVPGWIRTERAGTRAGGRPARDRARRGRPPGVARRHRPARHRHCGRGLLLVPLALSARYVPAGSPAAPIPLDVRGLLLLSTGLAALVYGLTGDGAIAVVALVAGAVLVAAYVWHALRTSRAPVLDLRLFRDRSFTACSVLVFVFGGSLFGATFLLPLLFQNVLGTDPLTAGLLMAPQGVGAMVGTVVVGRLVDRGISARTLVLTGIVLTVLGTLPFLVAGPGTPVPLLVGALVVRGLGLITAPLPSTTATYATLPRSAYAAATTATRIAQQVGGSLGTAVLAVVLAGNGFGAAFGVTVGITALAAVGALLLPGFSAAAGVPRRPTPSTGGRA